MHIDGGISYAHFDERVGVDVDNRHRALDGDCEAGCHSPSEISNWTVQFLQVILMYLSAILTRVQYCANHIARIASIGSNRSNFHSQVCREAADGSG